MPITKIIDSLATHVGTAAGRPVVFQRDHQECQETHQAGRQEMVSLVAQAAIIHSFNETALRQTLQAIANRSRATGEDIDRALEVEITQAGASAATGAADHLAALLKGRGNRLTSTITRRELRKWLRASDEGKAVETAVTRLLAGDQ